MRSKKLLPVFIGVGSVWLATAFGPGFSAGTMLNEFFTKHGFIGIFLPILAITILGIAIYFALEFARVYKTFNFRDYANTLFAPFSKFIGPLVDICFLFITISVLAACLAAGGTLLERFWDIPYWWGVGGIIVVGGLFCIFGAELVRRASSFIMIFATTILLSVVVLAFTIGSHDLDGSIANNVANAKDPNLLSAIWTAILYASFQACAIFNVISVAGVLKSKKDSAKSAIFGAVGNLLLLIPLILLMFSFTNVFAITSDPLPLYSIIQTLNIPWLTTVYVLLVLMAIISSIFAFIYAGIARYKKYVKIKNEKVRDGLIAVAILTVCVFVASFGFLTIVSVGFTAMGYVCLPIMLIPALFIASHKISKKYRDRHKK